MAFLTLLYAMNVVPLETIRRAFHDLNTRSVSFSIEAIGAQEMLNITTDMLSNSTYPTNSTLTHLVAESCPDSDFHDKWERELGSSYQTKLVLSEALPLLSLDEVSHFAPSGSAAELAIQHALVRKVNVFNPSTDTMLSYTKGGYYDLQKKESPPLVFKPMVQERSEYETCKHCPLPLMKKTIEIITAINKAMFVAEVVFVAYRDMLSGILMNELAEDFEKGARMYHQMLTAGLTSKETLHEIAEYDSVLAPFYRYGRDRRNLLSLFVSMCNRVNTVRVNQNDILSMWRESSGGGDPVLNTFKKEVSDAVENIDFWLNEANRDMPQGN